MTAHLLPFLFRSAAHLDRHLSARRIGLTEGGKRQKPIPQGLKPKFLPSSYVGAEAPTLGAGTLVQKVFRLSSVSASGIPVFTHSHQRRVACP
jgi:hypothetical protein